MARCLLVTLFIVTIFFASSYAAGDLDGAVRTHVAPGLGDYEVPFYAGGTYLDGVRSPDDFLGHPLGSKPSRHGDIIRYYEYLAETLDNVSLYEYARTYEGRRLVYLMVTSEENASRLDEIRVDLGKLSDPRAVDDGAARRVIESAPAVAWMAYGIHGDELSSSDAALQLAYQLAAGTDENSERIRDEVVVLIDPLQNPDGHERWLGMLEQYNSVVPSHDIQSLHHRGVWPAGRTNHYLFDLNRDWFALVHPETRGKTTAVLEWMPHYVLDCHEMGPTDTYLFSPPREPFNPFMVDYIYKWWDMVARDQAAAFDAYGWSYYTREWNEEFFPGYGSSWAIYLGAVGMLFEQAGVDGSQVKRPEGTVMTYRETVHHQFVGSLSNLLTVAENRRELLNDYYTLKRANVRGQGGAFVIAPDDNRSRIDRFAARLQHQHIEVERATGDFRAGQALSSLGERVRGRRFPEGSIIVRTNQPLKQLVEVILTFDIRVPTAFLESERKELLKHGGSRLYEATGWSLAHAYGLDAYYVESMPRVRTEEYLATTPAGGLTGEDSPVGFVFDCTDDRAAFLLARLLERDVKVWASRKPFETAGRAFPRGSYLIRHSGNPDLDTNELRELAEDAGVDVFGATTALAGAPHADLGGDEFRLLEPPRIALIAGYPTAYYSFGTVWHLLDARLNLRTTTLDVASLSATDLDKYNVLVLPHSLWGGTTNYKKMIGEAGLAKLKDWVRDGGTLIAEGNGAAVLADTSVALTSVRLRRQSLDKLDAYRDALDAAREADAPEIDSLAVWEGRPAPGSEESKASDEAKAANKEKLEQADERARKLFPRGAILAADLDGDHWMTAGCKAVVPVMFTTNFAYLAKGGVQVPARLAPAPRLRLAGLVWSEARERWAETAYATREPVGEGQVILFATLPNFRGYFYGTERLLINAMLLGPGLGARQSIDW